MQIDQLARKKVDLVDTDAYLQYIGLLNKKPHYKNRGAFGKGGWFVHQPRTHTKFRDDLCNLKKKHLMAMCPSHVYNMLYLSPCF